VLLVVTYSTAARTGLETCVAVTKRRSFGGSGGRHCSTRRCTPRSSRSGCASRTAGDVQIEQTEPFNEFVALDKPVREAAGAYANANRNAKSTPYAAFAAGTDHPNPDSMRGNELL